jgi:hypothetical protein
MPCAREARSTLQEARDAGDAPRLLSSGQAAALLDLQRAGAPVAAGSSGAAALAWGLDQDRWLHDPEVRRACVDASIISTN